MTLQQMINKSRNLAFIGLHQSSGAIRFPALVLAILSIAQAAAQAIPAFTWANANVTGTPVSPLNWFNPTQGSWTGGTPVSGNGNAIQFFQDTTTALLNTAVPSTQTSIIDNGGVAFQLGTLTLSGLASATASANLTITFSGDPLNFSAATGTINLNGLNNTQTLTYNLNSNIQLGTASSASVLTLSGNGTGTFGIGGIISELQSGGGSLIKSGSSVVTLSGANTYSGGTTINGGAIGISADGKIGAAPGSATAGNLVINGGTLWGSADMTLNANRGIALGPASGSGTGTIDITTAYNAGSVKTMTYGGIIANNGSGTGALTLLGNLTLSGNNTYSGITSITGNAPGSTLTISGAGSLGTGSSGTYSYGGNIFIQSANTTWFQYNSSATQTLSGTISGGGGISVNASNGMLILSGPNTFTWGSTLTSGTLKIISGTGLGGVGQSVKLNGGTLWIATSDGTLANTYNVAMPNTSVTATLKLDRSSGSNGTTVVFGTLDPSVNGVSSDVLNITQGAGITGQMIAQFTSVGQLAYLNNGNSIKFNPVGAAIRFGAVTAKTTAGYNEIDTVTLDGTSTNNAVTGAITEWTDGSTTNKIVLIKQNISTWSLSGGTNVYTGGTTVNGGTLILDYTSKNNAKLGTGTLTLGGGTITLMASSGSPSYVETATSATLNVGASYVNRTGTSANVLDLKAVTRNTGATLDFGADSIASGSITLANGIWGGWATVAGSDWATSTSGSDTPVTAYAGYNTSVPTSGGSTTVNYSLSGDNGAGLSGAATFGSLKIANSDNSQTFALNANNLTFTGTSGGLLYVGGSDNKYAITGTGYLGAGTTSEFILTTKTGTALTIGAPLIGSATSGSLTKNGGGIAILTAANTYTGVTRVGSGALLVNGSLSAGSAATVYTGGTLGGSGTINGTVTVNTGGTIQPSVSGSTNTLTLSSATAPTFNAGSILKIRVPTSTTADKVYLSSATPVFACGNIDLVIDTTGLPSGATGLTIVQVAKASGGITGTFRSVTANNGCVATVYYNTQTITLDLSPPTGYVPPPVGTVVIIQ